MCIRTVVCCEIPLPNKVLIDPPSTNTLWQCPGETQQSTNSAVCNWISSPRTESPHSSSSHDQEGRELTTLKEHFPCTCLSIAGCELLLPQVLVYRQGELCSVEEPRGRSSIWSVKFHGVCNDYCSSLCKWFSNCCPGTAKGFLDACLFIFLPTVKWEEEEADGYFWAQLSIKV